jgi:hypothetical protein
MFETIEIGLNEAYSERASERRSLHQYMNVIQPRGARISALTKI